uniref:Variant erythrocyte surface antigen-beta subunit n=1 Tax=Babesia bovis TaxID=5865 RepID=S6BL93_BABBO|nr:variant erythrocyte surface antigen- beta subunit [Babesia bovis]
MSTTGFYQLYFLRKQCKVGVAGDKVVLGWQSCRYGSGLRGAGSENWICQKSTGSNNGKCNCHSSTKSPLMLFLCDSVKDMHCGLTKGKTNSEDNPYPEIKEHWTFEKNPSPGHFGKPPKHCPVPMGWQQDGTSSSNNSVNHFKDLNNGSHKQASLDNRGTQKYPAHCTGRTLSYLLEYYCDPDKCSSGTLVVLLRLLACITPTVPRTLGDLFGFYYYIVYIGGFRSWLSKGEVKKALELTLEQYGLGMLKKDGTDGVVKALECYGGVTSASNVSQNNDGSLMRLYSHYSDPYLSPLSGQQYGQLSPAMAGTYLSWLVYLIEGFKTGLEGLKGEFQGIDCKNSECKGAAAKDCQTGCHRSSTGQPCECCCESVVSCTGVLPVLYKYGFGYGNVERLGDKDKRQCNGFLSTLDNVINSDKFTELINEINQLIYTTRLPWIFVLTIAWLVAVLYLAFGAIWPLDWTHMRSHCRGWFRKGSLSPWEVLMVGKKKGRGILEFFGGK